MEACRVDAGLTGTKFDERALLHVVESSDKKRFSPRLAYLGRPPGSAGEAAEV